MQTDDQTVSADFQAERQWVPLAQGIVEKSCPCMGLGEKQTGRLTMAVEEIVMHLAESAPGSAVHLEIIPGGWYVMARLSFAADPSDLWAMNLYAGAGVSADPELSHLGLVLASRMTDGFSIRLDGGIVCLSLRQDLAYPEIEATPGTRQPEEGALSIDPDPDADLVKDACVRAAGLYPARDIHQAFFTPGKVADMVAQKDVTMAVALTEKGETAGAVCWHSSQGKSLTFFGPYTFEEGNRCPALLTEHMIQRAARSGALGMFSGRATADLPPTDFECLGNLAAGRAGKNGDRAVKVWYRHLGEDPGTAVWSHPDLAPFLEERYKALVLMRQIRPTRDLGETLPQRSVISARLQPRLSEAILVPLVGGEDMADCLAGHVRTLTAEGYGTILLHLDLAYGWQAALAGPARETGFSPKVVLPYGGTSDIVVFQYDVL